MVGMLQALGERTSRLPLVGAGHSRRRTGLLIAVAAAFPLLVPNNYVLAICVEASLYIMLASGMEIVVGYTGLIDLGYIAFYAIGAYSSALLATHYGISFWLLLPVGAILAGLAGALLGFPVLRMRADYLAVVTLGFGEIIRLSVRNLDWLTGGPNGVVGVPAANFFGIDLVEPMQQYYLVLPATVLILIAVARLGNSRLGRAWMCIRDNEIAAEAVGINLVTTKLLAFGLGATCAGLAGVMFAAILSVVTPDSFSVWESVTVLIIVLIGGSGRLPGVFVGVAAMIVLPEALRGLQDYRFIVFGIVLIGMMIYRPQGLWPNKVRRYARGGGAADHLGGRGATRVTRPGAATGPLLQVRNLTKHFGGLAAVDDLDFVIEAGRVTALIGPNGAGKSTVFNLITGFTRPDRGEILFKGRPIHHWRPSRIVDAGIARTFQSIRLFGTMSVIENVMAGCHSRSRASVLGIVFRTPRQQAEERAIIANSFRQLEFVGLGNLAYTEAKNLSYGDQRRLEIARALATQPELLILDEPAAGMNDRERLDLTQLIRQIVDLGITVLLVEHTMPLIMGLADQIVVLNYGRRIAQGAPETIRNDSEVIEAYLGVEDDSLSA